jgi:hypothetical protein
MLFCEIGNEKEKEEDREGEGWFLVVDLIN